MSPSLILVLWLLGTAGVIWLLWWYIEVYSARKHMRESIREADAIMMLYRRRPPR